MPLRKPCCIKLILPLLLLLASCANPGNIAAPEPAPEDIHRMTAARRADPAYIQYLTRQSLLENSAEAARIVSGSQLAWQRPASGPNPAPLLRLAPNWLHINPLTLLAPSNQNAFSILANPILVNILEQSSLNGIYLAPAGGSGDLWAYGRNPRLLGEDIVQYAFSAAAGTEEDYLRLLDASNRAQNFLGLDLIPAATGMGPDFYLAARNQRGYPGLYVMIEVPRELWNALPENADQWLGQALGPEEVACLSARNLLPQALPEETLSFPRRDKLRGGWAATGEIRGVDGEVRRWVYRFHGSPERPLLNLEDPSASARRVFSASAIQNIGMRGSALAGLHLEAFYGLEAADNSNNPAGSYLEPARSAALGLAREIRRYGGWSWLRDEIPLDYMRELQSEGPDFLTDAVSSPAAEFAILSGDAGLLRFMFDEALEAGIDFRRMVHAMPSGSGISFALPPLAAMQIRLAGQEKGAAARALRTQVLQDMRLKVEAADFSHPGGKDLVPLKGDTLYAGSAGLAALALGAGNAENVQPEMIPLIKRGQLLLAFFKAMQPGLFMLSGQDVAGVTPLSWRSMRDTPGEWDLELTTRGAYALQQNASSLRVTGQGLPRAQSLYPAADAQILDAESFLASIGRILGLRERLGIAQGEMLARPLVRHKGSMAFAVRLPSGESGQPAALLVVCNFSRDTVSEQIDLTSAPELRPFARRGNFTVFSSEGISLEYAGSSSINLNLAPWQGAAILLGNDI